MNINQLWFLGHFLFIDLAALTVVVSTFYLPPRSSFFIPQSRKEMSRLWTLMTALHSLAGPATMLLYPLYASVIAIESTSKVDDEQWLAYWILYSFLTLMEMLILPLLEWIPIWYDLKLGFVAWLVLPQFRGAAFIYQKFVREKLIHRYYPTGTATATARNPNGKAKNKFVDFVTNHKGEHEAAS